MRNPPFILDSIVFEYILLVACNLGLWLSLLFSLLLFLSLLLLFRIPPSRQP